MRFEVDAIDVALLVARAVGAAGGAYFVGGSLDTWAKRLSLEGLLARARAASKP